MCEYFVKADPIQYEQRTRSVRIHASNSSAVMVRPSWRMSKRSVRRLAASAGATSSQLSSVPPIS